MLRLTKKSVRRTANVNFRHLSAVASIVLVVAFVSFAPNRENKRKNSVDDVWDRFLPAAESAADYCTEKDAPALGWIRGLYESQFSSLKSKCERVQRVGSVGDGGKLICTDVLRDESDTCIVYSLGSNLDFSFETSVRNILGCEVFTFDCTLGAVNRSNVPKGINFYPWCVGGKTEKKVISSNFGLTGDIGQYYPLSYIMRRLGHSRVDLLKMDIERHELAIIASLSVEYAPQQILFETHLHNAYGIWGRPVTRQEWRAFWNKIGDMGYRIFSFEPNPLCLCCCEWSVIRQTR